MGIYSGSSGSSSGGIYSSSSPTTVSSDRFSAPAKKKGKSVGGFLHNALSGAEHSITGAMGGIEQLGAATIHDLPAMLELKPFWANKKFTKTSELNKIGDTVSAQYKKKYGPLFKGHPGETLNQIYKDPFGTALDIGALVSGGVGAATKAGVLAKAADEISLAAESGSTVEKAVTGGELARRLKIGMDANLKRLPPDMRILGENARSARLTSYRLLKKETGMKLGVGKYHAALSRLSEPEANAVHILEEFPTRKLVEEEKARLVREVGPDAPIFKMYNDPEILKLVDKPTQKMLDYFPESAALGQKAADILESGVVHKGGKLGDVPALTSKTAALRRYQPALITRGAKVDEKLGLVAPEGQTIPGMVDQISKEIASEDRHQPIYHPQHMGKERGGMAVGTGGVGVTQSPVHMNRGILQTVGKVAYHIDTLTPAYMRAVKFALYSDRHAELMRSAIKVKTGTEVLGKDGKIRAGYWILHNRAEKISNTEKMSPQFDAELERMFPTEEITGKDALVADARTQASHPDILVDKEGYRYWVPKATADKIVGEYVRSSNAARWIWEKPTTVWRHLVLNLRVGWLTNNVVGNTMMYAIRMNGPIGLRTYAQEIARRFGPAYVKRMVENSGLSLEEKAQIFSEHVAGTAYGTQVPEFGTSKVSQFAKKIAKRTTEPLRRGDIAYEQTLRGAKIDELIQNSPEFAKALEEMPAQTRTFRQASLKALEDNPKLAERVSQEVNGTMGNFLQMSHVEQAVLRQASPFYAWYREIAKITLRLPLEVPGRTLALEQLGQIGFAENVKQLGPEGIESYLRALIPLSKSKGGRILGLNTGGLNPYMTVPQEATALKALFQLEAAGVIGHIPGTPITINKPNSNDTQQLLGMINPMVGGPLQTLTGAKGSVVSGLPEVRFIQAMAGAKSKSTATYNKTRLSELLSYLGVPVKDVSLYNARTSYNLYHGK